jgi:hypothetical protein
VISAFGSLTLEKARREPDELSLATCKKKNKIKRNQKKKLVTYKENTKKLEIN